MRVCVCVCGFVEAATRKDCLNRISTNNTQNDRYETLQEALSARQHSDDKVKWLYFCIAYWESFCVYATCPLYTNKMHLAQRRNTVYARQRANCNSVVSFYHFQVDRFIFFAFFYYFLVAKEGI